MVRAKSARFRASAGAVSAAELPLLLLEVHHALLAEPLRFVADVQDVVSNGHNYIATNFGFTWPDDHDKKTPKASLTFSDGRGAVSAFLDRVHGGRGATFEILQIMRSHPDFIEDHLSLDVSNLRAANGVVYADLGYNEVLNLVGTPYTYRPETAPGLF